MYYKVASQLAATLHIIYYWILCIARDETQQLDVKKTKKKECDQTSDTTTFTHSFARLVRIHRHSYVIQLSSKRLKHVNTNTKQLRVKLSKNRSHFFSVFFSSFASSPSSPCLQYLWIIMKPFLLFLQIRWDGQARESILDFEVNRCFAVSTQLHTYGQLQ